MADRIQEYAAPLKLGEISDRASAAHVTAGRRISMQYNEAGAAYDQMGKDIGGTVAQLGKAYLDYQTHKEVSSGGLHASSILLNKTAEWNDAVKNSDPNDPSTQPKFLGGLEKTLDDFRQSFSTEEGQKWADHRANAIRDHFNTATTADMSTASGVAVHNNAVQSINNYTAIVDKDPSSISLIHDLFKGDIKDLVGTSPNLKGAAAQKVLGDVTQKGMEQITRAAIASAIRKGTDGSEIADDKRFSPYVNAQERQQMVSMQRQEERLARADDRYAKQQEREAKQEQSEKAVFDVFRSLNSEPDANGQQPPQMTKAKINEMADQNLFYGRGYEHAIGLFERATKEETPARISEANSAALLDRMRLPPGSANRLNSTDELYTARIKGQISKADLNDLLRHYTDLREPEGQKLGVKINDFLNGFKGQLTTTIVGKSVDPTGDERFYDFRSDVERKVAEYRRQGKNPWDLFDRTKPDYLGTTENITSYIKTMDARVRDAIKRGARAPITNFNGN